MRRKAASTAYYACFKRQRSPGLSPNHSRAALAGEGIMPVAAVTCQLARTGATSTDVRSGMRLPAWEHLGSMEEKNDNLLGRVGCWVTVISVSFAAY